MSDNEGMHSLCWVFAKLHEVVFYGLVSTAACVCADILAPTDLFHNLKGFRKIADHILYLRLVTFNVLGVLSLMAVFAS